MKFEEIKKEIDIQYLQAQELLNYQSGDFGWDELREKLINIQKQSKFKSYLEGFIEFIDNNKDNTLPNSSSGSFLTALTDLDGLYSGMGLDDEDHDENLWDQMKKYSSQKHWNLKDMKENHDYKSIKENFQNFMNENYNENKDTKSYSFIDLLNDTEGRKLIDSAEEYVSDLRDQPGRKEHIEGLRYIANELKNKFGYDYDMSEEESNYTTANNLNEEYLRTEMVDGLKLNSKYHQSQPIKDAGYELIDDEAVSKGDIIWSEETGKLVRSRHDFPKDYVKQSMLWKVIKIDQTVNKVTPN